MFIFNGVLMFENSSPLHKFSDRLIEERKDIKFSMEQGKRGIRTLKRWCKEELDTYELSDLASCLGFINVDTECISILLRKLRQMEYAAEEFSMFDVLV